MSEIRQFCCSTKSALTRAYSCKLHQSRDTLEKRLKQLVGTEQLVQWVRSSWCSGAVCYEVRTWHIRSSQYVRTLPNNTEKKVILFLRCITFVFSVYVDRMSEMRQFCYFTASASTRTYSCKKTILVGILLLLKKDCSKMSRICLRRITSVFSTLTATSTEKQLACYHPGGTCSFLLEFSFSFTLHFNNK